MLLVKISIVDSSPINALSNFLNLLGLERFSIACSDLLGRVPNQLPIFCPHIASHIACQNQVFD